MFFETMIKNLLYSWINVVFRLMAILYYVNMNRFMIIRIKFENKSKDNKNCRHSIFDYEVMQNLLYSAAMPRKISGNELFEVKTGTDFTAGPRDQRKKERLSVNNK